MGLGEVAWGWGWRRQRARCWCLKGRQAARLLWRFARQVRHGVLLRPAAAAGGNPRQLQQVSGARRRRTSWAHPCAFSNHGLCAHPTRQKGGVGPTVERRHFARFLRPALVLPQRALLQAREAAEAELLKVLHEGGEAHAHTPHSGGGGGSAASAAHGGAHHHHHAGDPGTGNSTPQAKGLLKTLTGLGGGGGGKAMGSPFTPTSAVVLANPLHNVHHHEGLHGGWGGAVLGSSMGADEVAPMLLTVRDESAMAAAAAEVQRLVVVGRRADAIKVRGVMRWWWPRGVQRLISGGGGGPAGGRVKGVWGLSQRAAACQGAARASTWQATRSPCARHSFRCRRERGVVVDDCFGAAQVACAAGLWGLALLLSSSCPPPLFSEVAHAYAQTALLPGATRPPRHVLAARASQCPFIHLTRTCDSPATGRGLPPPRARRSCLPLCL